MENYQKKNYVLNMGFTLEITIQLLTAGFLICSAIEDYLNGKGSLRDIVAKYGIPAKETLRQWVLLYNANRELKDYCPNREVYMAEVRRKTTIKERKEIVEYCINHERNYKDTASVSKAEWFFD